LSADSRVFSAERAVVWHPMRLPTSEPLWDGAWQGVFFGQWYAKRAEFPRAWDKTMGRASDGRKPVVGVVDTNFQKDHPDYAVNVDSRSHDFTANGLPEHGTGVVGEIGSAWNGMGVAGECPNASLMLLSVGYPDGSQFGGIDSTKVIEAVNYFVAN